MNIAFFTDTYLPNKDGVVETLLNLRKELKRRGHNVYVFTPSPTGEEFVEDDVFYFKSVEFPPYPQYRVSFPSFPKVVDIAKNLSLDIVHNHGIALTSWAALAIAKNLSLPSITTFHTDISQATHYISENLFVKAVSKKIVWSYLRFLYSRFDVVTAPSKKSVSMLKSNNINAVYLPNGIRTSLFSPSRKKNYKRKDFLLHVGRLVKEKNIDFIFPCIKKYNSSKKRKKIKLLIAGKGPAEDYYREKVKSFGIEEHVEFLGFVSDKKLRKLYREAKALVFLSKFDTQGLVVLEALASATPVLYRKGTAAEEIAKSLGLGFSSCRSFYSSYKRLDKVSSSRCVEIARQYDIKRVVSKLLSLYKFLL